MRQLKKWLEAHTPQLWLGGATGKIDDNSGHLISRGWFRGDHCNFYPRAEQFTSPAVALDLLRGWLPAAPRIGPETRIAAFGSCFAYHVARFLNERNYRVLTQNAGSRAYVVQCSEGIVTTFTIRQQFEWALEGKSFANRLWFGDDAKAIGDDDDLRRQTRDLFLASDLFVITLGLSEVWYDEPTGEVFSRTLPADRYDPARHKFRVSSVAENRDNLDCIFALIKKHCPAATVIFTLSPIPLAATFRPASCITASSASKAILRAALDEFMRGQGERDNLYYWPSYELALDLFDDQWKPDRRHLKQPVVDFIMTLFERAWCIGDSPDLDAAWQAARRATRPARTPATKT